MASYATYLATVMPCKHVVEYAPIPHKGDVLWCYRCHDYRRCVHVEKPWRMHCVTCDLVNYYAMDTGRLLRWGIRHLRENPGHVVYRKRGEGEQELVGGSPQDPLPFVIET